MTDIFWDEQTDPEEEEVHHRRPWWVIATAAVDWIILLAVLPAALMVLFPFFFLFYVMLAGWLVFISPVLLVINALMFGWALRRKQAGTVTLGIVGIFLTLVSFLIVLAWQGQFVILGIGF